MGERANWVVTVGLLLNLWVIFILWLGGRHAAGTRNGPGDRIANLWRSVSVINGLVKDPNGFVFYQMRALALCAVAASMMAYMAAQFCDVYLFHFWKKLTHGKHLWLRNNGSTLISQLVDTVAVILITHFYAHALPIPADLPAE